MTNGSLNRRACAKRIRPVIPFVPSLFSLRSHLALQVTRALRRCISRISVRLCALVVSRLCAWQMESDTHVESMSWPVASRPSRPALVIISQWRWWRDRTATRICFSCRECGVTDGRQRGWAGRGEARQLATGTDEETLGRVGSDSDETISLRASLTATHFTLSALPAHHIGCQPSTTLQYSNHNFPLSDAPPSNHLGPPLD